MAIPLAHNEPALRKPNVRERFVELSAVALTHALDIEGRALPAGTLGTVVAAYSDGVGYEVEFDAPFHAVVTLQAGDLTA